MPACWRRPRISQTEWIRDHIASHNIKYVQEQTIANKKRLEERDPAQRAKRFEELRATAEDPQRHKAFLMRASLLESSR